MLWVNLTPILLIVTVLLAMLLGPFLKRPAAGQWPRLVAVAICNGVLHFGLNFWALRLSATLAPRPAMTEVSSATIPGRSVPTAVTTRYCSLISVSP